MKWGFGLLLLVATSASATNYAQPTRHRVYSQNKAYFLDVNPETDINTVFAAGESERALWSFSKPVWHYPFLVSNDGHVVATLPWRLVEAEELHSGIGVELWNSQGIRRTYPVAELCSDPPKATGATPIGGSWHTWYTSVEDHGTWFTVWTECGSVHHFSYAAGSVATIRSPRPQRLLWPLAGILGGALATLVVARRWRALPNPAFQPTPHSRRG